MLSILGKNISETEQTNKICVDGLDPSQSNFCPIYFVFGTYWNNDKKWILISAQHSFNN